MGDRCFGVGGTGPAGAAGPAGPAGPAGSGDPKAPDWAWLDLPGVEGVDTDFDLGDWAQATAGALSPVVLAPVLAADSKSIVLTCPSGYGAFLRPQAMAIGSDVCFRVQLLMASATGLATALTAQFQVGAFESGAAATQYAGVGGRWPAQTVFGTSVQLSVRGNAAASIATDGVIGSEGTVNGALFSQPIIVRLRRVGATLEMYVAESFGRWKFVATPPEATLDAALAGLHVGIRWRGTTTQTAIISGYLYAPGGVV
jgi:hypothetical protein